jgi:hypothetical protein
MNRLLMKLLQPSFFFSRVIGIHQKAYRRKYSGLRGVQVTAVHHYREGIRQVFGWNSVGVWVNGDSANVWVTTSGSEFPSLNCVGNFNGGTEKTCTVRVETLEIFAVTKQ